MFGGSVRSRHMKTFIATIALLVFDNASAHAVGVAGADHNWTIHVGDCYYGLSGYKAKTLPGLRIPNETRLHFGTKTFSLLLPFHLMVAGTGAVILGGAAVTGTMVFGQRK